MIFDPFSVVPLIKRGKRDDFGGRKERRKVGKGERGPKEIKSREDRRDRENGNERRSLEWVGRRVKRREERKRGRERKKEREGGSVKEEKRKKGVPQHLSLK